MGNNRDITRYKKGYRFTNKDWFDMIIENPKRQITYSEAIKVYNQFWKPESKL